MHRWRVGMGVVVGLAATAPLLAIEAVGYRLARLPFSPFDFFDWITRVLPGRVVTFGIDSMIWALDTVGLDVADSAKTAERAVAVLQFLVLGVVVAVLFFVFSALRRVRPDGGSGAVLGAAFAMPMIAVSLGVGQSPVGAGWVVLWLLVLFVGWGMVVARGRRRAIPAAGAGAGAVALDRRRFLVRLGTASAVVTVAGAGLAEVLARRERGGGAARASTAHRTETGKGTPFPNADDPVMPAPGTRPEYTPLKDHYKVFIRTEPTVIDGDDWELTVDGLVEEPLRLRLADLRGALPQRDQYVTISCISGRVATGLIGTTLWSGVPLAAVLEAARPKPGARWLHVHSGDGYYETVDLELVARDPPAAALPLVGRAAAAGRPRLPAAHLDPRPLRDEAAQVDPLDRGLRPLRARLLGRAGLGPRGAGPDHLGDRHRRGAGRLRAGRAAGRAGGGHRLRRRARHLPRRGEGGRRTVGGGAAARAAVRRHLGDLALRLALRRRRAHVHRTRHRR